MITCGRELVAGTDAMNQLLPIVASSPLPALVAAAGERASIRVLEFFAASGAGAAAPLRQIHRARSERSGRNYFTAAMISPPALCRAPRPRLVHRRRRKSRGFLRGLHLQACRRGCDQGHARCGRVRASSFLYGKIIRWPTPKIARFPARFTSPSVQQSCRWSQIRKGLRW
jgi:hypothetical protein